MPQQIRDLSHDKQRELVVKLLNRKAVTDTKPNENVDWIADPETFWPKLMQEISTWKHVEESNTADPPTLF